MHRLTSLKLNGAATSLSVLVSSSQKFLQSLNSLDLNKGQLSFCSNCCSSPALLAMRWLRIWCSFFQIWSLPWFSEFSHWPSKANWIYNTSYRWGWKWTRVCVVSIPLSVCLSWINLVLGWEDEGEHLLTWVFLSRGWPPSTTTQCIQPLE